MHDTDTNLTSQQSSLREKAPTARAHPQDVQSSKASLSPHTAHNTGLLQRILSFFTRLFTRKQREARVYVADPVAASRAAVSLAAQMAPPVAFKGDTTSTLVTPMGAYAGNPVNHAMRKRAEQQFVNMDISNTTMN